jgi:hypothetical protein
MTEEQLLNKVHTSCKNCIWANYEGNTQIDCGLGRIKKYKNVIECYDEEKEFFVINKAYCLFYRNKDTVDVSDLEDLYKHIRKQAEIQYQLIIILEDKQDIYGTFCSIESAIKQDVKPKILTVVNRSKKAGVGKELADYLRKYDKVFNIWKVQNLVNTSLTREDCVDIVLDGTMYKTFSLYVVINSGFELPDTFSEELDSAINDEILTFAMLLPDENGNGMVVPKMVHKIYNGNSHGIYLETKIREFLCNSEAQIIPISKVCQSFQK